MTAATDAPPLDPLVPAWCAPGRSVRVGLPHSFRHGKVGVVREAGVYRPEGRRGRPPPPPRVRLWVHFGPFGWGGKAYPAFGTMLWADDVRETEA